MISSNLLRALLSPDGSIRSQAETAFHSLSVTDRVQGLLLEITNSSGGNDNDDCQRIAAVLLRRDLLKLTDANMLQQLVAPLLQAFQNDGNSCCQNQIGHCLAELCACLSVLTGNVDSAMETILSSLDTTKVPSLKLMAQLADRAPMAFAKLAVPSLPNVLQPPTTEVDAKMEAWTLLFVNAAMATTATKVELIRMPVNLDDLVVHPNSPAAVLGTTCLPTLLLPWISSCQNEHAVQSALQHLSEAATTCPSFLAATPALLESVTSTCLELAKQNHHSTSLRLTALGVLTSLLSVGDVRRRVLPPAVATAMADTALPICAQLLVESTDPDVQEWASEPATLVDDGFEEDEDGVFVYVESLLQHLGAPALNALLPLVQQLLESSNSSGDAWTHAHGGLLLLEAALAATPVSIAPHMAVIANAAVSFAASHNAQIQYRALRLLGVLSSASLAQSVLDSKIILERLAAALPHTCTKVSSTASLSLVSFCRGHEQAEEAVLPFLPDLLSALVQGPLSLTGLDTGSVTVRVRAMGATACLAQVAGEEFAAYYATIMPGLLSTAQQPNTGLAGSAVEAATIVGQSVGRELFAADSLQLLSWILPTLATNPLEELLLACARIASVLEEDFAPHADAVMPLLLKQAQQPADVSVMEGEEVQTPVGVDGDGTMTAAVPGRGMVKVSINTSKIQEKAQAARAVYEMSKGMGAAFGPWLQRSFDVFLPLVSFPYSADVRSTAAQTLSAIFDAACAHGDEVVDNMQLPQHYLPLLVESIARQIAVESPMDLEALYALGDSLSEVLYIVSRYRNEHGDILAKYSMANAEASVESCMTTLKACLERRANLARVVAGPTTGEDEKEEYNDLLSLEENILTPLVDSVGYNLKFFQQEFVPLFEQKVVTTLGPSLTSLLDIRATISAMLLFDDCVEHCGPEAATRYAPLLLQGIMLAFSTTDKDLVQAAVYGVAQIARKAPNVVSMDQCLPIVQKLLDMTSQTKDEDNGYLLELSASALASLTLFGRFFDIKCISRDHLIKAFLSQLPIQCDDDEAKICHAQFCQLVEGGAIDLSIHAGLVAKIVGTILADVQAGQTEIATPDTCERLATILYQMQQNLPPTTMQQSFGALDANSQNIVSAILQDVTRSRSHVVTP